MQLHVVEDRGRVDVDDVQTAAMERVHAAMDHIKKKTEIDRSNQAIKERLERGDELLWQKAEDGIRVRKATRSAGRGMLVDDDVPEEKSEEMAEEMEAEIREMRRTEWQP